MAKAKTAYVCNECGDDYPKWQGQCSSCNSWNTLEEVKVGGSKHEARNNRTLGYAGAASAKRVKLKDVSAQEKPRIKTGYVELDRVLGGGIMPGSALLIGGNPGAGKSTLLLQVTEKLVGINPLYVTGEESLDQVASRSERLKLPSAGNIVMMAETNVENILAAAREMKPGLLIIDSIQSVYTPDSDSAPGSISQVRDCAAIITQYAKQSGCTVFMIGHMTKDSTIAGPQILMHIVDGVFEFEGSSDSRYRMLRSKKNRFGAVNELGCFAMMEEGMREVSNPSAIFLSRPERPVSGSVVAVLWEGTRPMLVEIQALADTDGNPGNPRRVALGIDSNRINMMLAIMNRHSDISSMATDVYVNVVGGVKVTETSTDLAVVLAFASSLRDRPIPQDVIVMGELGLSGEIRPVQHGPERLKEAAKHGFKRAIIPKSNSTKKIEGMTLYPAENLREALNKLEDLS